MENQNQSSLRDKISAYFEVNMRNESFRNYFSELNERGKISARSTLEVIMILCEKIEELEERGKMPPGAYLPMVPSVFSDGGPVEVPFVDKPKNKKK